MKKVEPREQVPGLARFVIDQASVCAIWMDPRGVLTYVNKAACSMLGYFEDDLLGRSVCDIDSRLNRTAWHDFWKELKREGSKIRETEYRRNDGSTIPVEITANYVSFGMYKYCCLFISRTNVEGQAYRSNEGKYGGIFDGVSDAWYFHDLNGKFMETNPAFRKIFGYPEKDPLPADFHVKDLLTEDLKPFAEEYLKTIIRDKKSEGLMKILCRDGVERIIEYKNTLVFGSDGKVTGVSGTGRDITERYRYRKEMKEIEQRYRDIFDNVTDLLYFHDLDGNFDLKQCNPAVRQQLVGRKSNVETVNIRKFMPEPFRAGFDDYLERVKRKGRDVGLFTIINHSGHEVVMEYRNSLVTGENGPIGIRGSARDITERILSERALRKSEEKYRTILESIEHGYYEVDIKGNITFVNDSVCRIFGIGKEELIGADFSTFTDQSTAKNVSNVFNSVFKTGSDLKDIEWEFTTRDGRKIFIEVSVSRILSGSGRCRGFRGIIRDVTQRVMTELALKESESKYRNILENIEEGYYEADLKGNYTFFNSSLCRILGISREKLLGRSYSDFVDDDTSRSVFRVFNEVYTSGKDVESADWEITRLSDGSKIYIEISIYRIPGSEGKCKGFRGMVRDVTTRIQAEKALMESEQRYRLLAENVNDIIWTADLNYHFTYVSPWVKQVARATAEETMKFGVRHVMKKEMFDKIHDDFEGILKRIRKGERRVDTVRRYEFEHGRGDGTTFWADTVASVQFDKNGKPIGFVGITRDITERKKAEEEVRKSEAKYRSILEGMQEGYYEADLDGNLTFFNDSFSRIVGYERRELESKSYKAFVDDENASNIFQAFHRVFETGNPEKGLEWEFVRKDGSRVQVETSVLLMREADGEAFGFRGVIQDITARKKAEQETRLLEEKLKNAQKMEALGTLAGGVAHDLNNILSGIVSYPEILLMTLNDGSPLKEPLRKIQKSGERAAAVVQDLLTLARRGVAVKETINLNEIIKEYLNSTEYNRLISLAPDIHIDFKPGNDLFNNMGSPAHILKSIMNLISNAAEAMPEGGTVTLETCNTVVRGPGGKNELPQGKYVSLSVTDTGTGISDEDMPRIFEPFYTKKKMGRSGTGLGLAVVWGTVQDHSGYIEVGRKEGKTTFTLYFPATLNKLHETRSQIPIQDYMGKGEKILVVDDNEEQREVASDMLSFLGYQVVTVSSGEDAVIYMKGHHADLILLDMIMEQGIDGLETYEKILEVRPGQKAVIASGYSETDRVRRAQELGAGRYIKKPYLMEELGMAVMLELKKTGQNGRK